MIGGTDHTVPTIKAIHISNPTSIGTLKAERSLKLIGRHIHHITSAGEIPSPPNTLNISMMKSRILNNAQSTKAP